MCVLFYTAYKAKKHYTLNSAITAVCRIPGIFQRTTACYAPDSIGIYGVDLLPQQVSGDDMKIAKHMSARKLVELVRAGNPPVLLDVRTRWEYNCNHVPGAIHMPFWLSFTRVNNLTTPKGETVVVYCEHGPRAGITKFALILAGFTSVLYLEGHMLAWRRAGLPTEKGSTQ